MTVLLGNGAAPYGRLPDRAVHTFACPRPALVCGLSTGRATVFALSWQAAAFALLSAQLLLVCLFGVPALAVGLLGLTLLFVHRPLAGITLFLQVLLYQNLLVSIFCPWGFDEQSFPAVQGTSFAGIACMAAVAVVRVFLADARNSDSAKLARWICASLVIIVVYTAYGMLGSTPASALTYFRNTSAMLLALLVGLDAGRSWDYRTIATIFVASLGIGLALAAAEYWLPDVYYTAMHVRDFTHLRAHGQDVPEISRSVDEIIRARVVTWFNITGGAGGALSVRILGSNMEAVSYTYVIACGGIVLATLGRYGLATVALLLLVFAGVKGPLLMLTLTLAIGVLWRVTRNGRIVLFVSLALLFAYVAQGIAIGLSNGDLHVIGLMGGVNGFLKNPWGHGIGVGGNLSAEAADGVNWSAWQKAGADFALESAVGVLLYQMGVAAAAVYVPIVELLRRGFRRQVPAMRKARGQRLGPRPSDLLLLGIAVTLANGFFQEEAYSPYALGLLTLFGGVIVANAAQRRAA